MPGLTAYFGMKEIGAPKPGDTVVVQADDVQAGPAKQLDVLVLGGAPGMLGAAWLAASAALAAGAGRVYAALPDDDDHPWPARPELMRWPEARWQDARHWQDLTLVAGCGAGTAIAPVAATISDLSTHPGFSPAVMPTARPITRMMIDAKTTSSRVL